MPNKSLPLRMPDDSPEMVEAVDAISKLTKRITRKTKHQLKIGIINFYPDRGTIHIDNGPTLQKGGLEVLAAILARPHSRLEHVLDTCKELHGVLPAQSYGLVPVKL